jgi:hypothetical protein
LAADDTFHVGWIGINLSGYGYLYPWTFADLVHRADQEPAIGKMTALCRDVWPVIHSKPSWRQRRARRKMGELWPYPSTAMPLDWYWGLGEGG